jgi:nucleotidyltransferase/DNA polymerase involved in DNA repair
VGGALSSEFNVSTVGELQQVPYDTLVRRFGELEKKRGGMWIYRIARGICLDAVSDRELARRYECLRARTRSHISSSRVHTKGCSCSLPLPPSSPQLDTTMHGILGVSE